MTWMLTSTGAAVELRWLAADSIDLLDIAHHLAQINRYNGAARRPYSVAEHSLLVAEIMERDLGIRSPSALLAGLMHDAHEAYTGDLSSPMKQVLGDAWHNVESRVAYSVQQRFGIASASAGHADAIKWADLKALATERAQLMPPGGPAWPVMQSHPPVGWVILAHRAGMEWTDWRQAFLDRFSELNYARGLQVEACIRSATH